MEKSPPHFKEGTKENRKKGAEHVIEFLEQSHLVETFTSTEKKQELLANFTREQILAFLERLNGSLIGMPIEEREAFVYQSSVVNYGETKKKHIYTPPDPKAAEKIIDTIVLPTLKELTELDMNEAAEFAAICINLLHMFPDGNGRLSRLVHALLVEYNFDYFTARHRKEFEETLYNRKKHFTCDPSIIKNEINEIIESSILHSSSFLPLKIDYSGPLTITEADPKLKREKEQVAHLYEIDKTDFQLGILWYMRKVNPQYAEHCTSDEEYLHVNVQDLFNSITTKNALDQLYISYQVVKKLRFNVFRQLFLTPNAFPSPVPGVNLKKYFESKIVQIALYHRSIGAEDMNMSG